MRELWIVAIVLIAASVIALVYGGITHPRTTHDTQLGPVELSLTDKVTINFPAWAGVGAVLVSGALLFVLTKGRGAVVFECRY